jgi:hypothetical protein
VFEVQDRRGLVIQSLAVPVTLTPELRSEDADVGALERATCAGLVARLERVVPGPRWSCGIDRGLGDTIGPGQDGVNRTEARGRTSPL